MSLNSQLSDDVLASTNYQKTSSASVVVARVCECCTLRRAVNCFLSIILYKQLKNPRQIFV